MTTRQRFATIVVGGGPAGFAPLVAASRFGLLDDILAGGVAIVDRGPTLGAGRLGSYGIGSDSTAATFLTAVDGHADPRLAGLSDAEPCRALRALGTRAAPLPLVAELMTLVGGTLATAVVEAGGRLLGGHEALSARRDDDGLWRLHLRPLAGGRPVNIAADTLVIAAGGGQTRERLLSEPVAGEPLLPRHADRLMLSDEILRADGLARVGAILAGRAAPRIVVAGASTSALSVVSRLLRAFPQRLDAPGSVTVLHRREPRMFYPSPAAALAEGYAAFGPDDICPVSGFVFRLAGFREESRELAMGMLGICGRPPEPRARFHRIAGGTEAEARRLLDEADLVVAALGYRPNLLPLAEADGTPIVLAGRCGRPAVDGECRILDKGGHPVPGVLGLGLAAGFRPVGRYGGEPSFQGQANGLWLWQNAVGRTVADAILAAPRSRPAEDGWAAGLPPLQAWEGGLPPWAVRPLPTFGDAHG